MSDQVVLTLRSVPSAALDAGCVAPDRFSSMSEHEIAGLEVWSESEGRGTLGDYFTVRGERSARVRVEGDLSRVDALGQSMAGGELSLIGDTGAGVGARMTDGRLLAEGNTGADAGREMRGGALIVSGNAGANAGGAGPGANRGMTGGELIVLGSSGPGAAARVRRGLIFIGGEVAANAGQTMIAGTFVAMGRLAPDAGRWMKRGSIIALGGVEISATYRYACTYRPPHVRQILNYLRGRYGVPVTPAHVGGAFRRYSGDLAEQGKGEILEWTTA